jgi:hypothetical protein
MENRLCNSFVANTSEKSKFFAFEIRTVREEISFDDSTFMRLLKTISDFNDDDDAIDEPFYRVFGLYFHTENDMIPYREVKEKQIKDFFKIEHAREFLQDLTGVHVHVYSY